jgi:acyl-CoA thioester hydrolase
MRNEYSHWMTMAVRWGDMDAFGHVNNAVFFTYFESVRIHFFDAVELFELAEADHHRPAVVSANCNFRQQVHYPADLDLGIRVAKVGNTSFTLEYVALRAGTDEVVADGTSAIVWVNYETGRPIPIPDIIRQAINPPDYSV